MEINDFSSVFELLCGYNLINAINSNSDLLKVLDFASPIKEGISEFQVRLKNKTAELIANYKDKQSSETENDSSELDQKLQLFYTVRERADALALQNNQHSKKSANLYLIGGIFSFIILIGAPFINDYHKLNSVAAIIACTHVLYSLFLKCDYPPQNKLYKLLSIGVITILSIFVVSSTVFKYSLFGHGDRSFLIAIFPLSSMMLFMFLRERIVGRKIFKGLFVTVFLGPLLIPDSSILYSFFYTKHGEMESLGVGFLVVCCVLTCLEPLVYDIIKTNKYQSSLAVLEKKVNPEYNKVKLSSDIQEGGVGKSGRETDPINIPA